MLEPANVIANWGFGSGAPELGLISTIATDSAGMVYVLCRLPRGVMHVFRADGTYVRSWNQHAFASPHGLWISPDDQVFTTDIGDHTVRVFDTAGNLQQTIGTPGQSGGAGEPFNAPTRAFAGPSGDIFVSDGYGNCRVHRFSPDGRLLHSWGEPGRGSGQFDTPHSLWVDEREQVYVVDRGNARVQVFEGDGRYVTEWRGLHFPHDIFITGDGVAMVTDCAERQPESATPYHALMPANPIRQFTLDGEEVGGIGEAGDGPGLFLDCPHCIWIDGWGDAYVSEVVTPNRLQKFRGA